MTLSATSTEVLAAAQQLPDGATLIIPKFSWDDYEELLSRLGDSPGLRVSYDGGRLEILSPLVRHERYARVIDSLLLSFCISRGWTVEMFGQATWKKRVLAKGVEADACYYVRNAAAVIGKKDFSLESDPPVPPPDIAVEIDLTSRSLRKLPIYAALQVPEVWINDGNAFKFYELSGDQYAPVQESRMMPGLFPASLANALAQSDKEGLMAALNAFRRSLRET